MNIDNKLYSFPVIGRAYKRMHAYFRTQVTLTDILHVLIGIGIGFVIVNRELNLFEIIIFSLGISYHALAFVKGSKK